MSLFDECLAAVAAAFLPEPARRRPFAGFPGSILNYTPKMPAARQTPAILWPAAVFSAVLTALLAATVAAVDGVPVLRAAAADLLAAEQPEDRDHYLAGDIGGQVDHHVLFFGIDPEALARLTAAEVLFVGNSRLMFALRPDVLRPAFAATGQSYYALGFGFRETDRFPLAIIRRFNLRPRVVVVNADGFFGGGLSDWAEVVNRDTAFAARKLRLEAEIAHGVRRAIHLVAPNWLALFGRPGLGHARELNLYRSRFDGTWQVSPWPQSTKVFTPPALDGSALGRGEIAAARAFKAELDARGVRLVLTRVPTPEPHEGGGPARFAKLLQVPLVVVDTPGLTSGDRSHLDEASAHDWSRAFVTALAPHLAGPGAPR